jgi:hypothetical protein
VVLSLFAQNFVVGELFVKDEDTTAPSALAAFRAINDDNYFENFIPLIWKYDDAMDSIYENRVRAYNISSTPRPLVKWNSTLESPAPDSDHFAIQNYRKYYSAAEFSQTEPFPFLRIDFLSPSYPFFKGEDNELLIVPSHEITALNNLFSEPNAEIFYIITYAEDYDYFSRVMLFAEGAGEVGSPIPFPSTIDGSVALPDKILDLTTAFVTVPSPNKLSLVIMVQRTVDPFEIFYAARYPLAIQPPPTNVHYFAGTNKVTVLWDPPAGNVEGYLVTRMYTTGDRPESTVQAPLYEFLPADFVDEDEYVIQIRAIYNSEAELYSDPVIVSIPVVSTSFRDLGVGSYVSGIQSGSPLNVYQKSLRSQFVYKHSELDFAGMTGQYAIHGIGLNVVDIPTETFTAYTIRLREVPEMNVIEHIGGTYENYFSYVVTNATLNVLDDGWVMFNFVTNPETDEPFVWNGKENILVDISFGQNAETSSSGSINMFKTQYGFRYSWASTGTLLNTITDFYMPYKPALRIKGNSLSIGDTPLISMRDTLYNNFPNPFNPTTTISFDIVSDTNVRIDVYNIKGQLVKTLVDAPHSVGAHRVNWDGKDATGRDVASGVYLYQMSTDTHTDVKKMILMK